MGRDIDKILKYQIYVIEEEIGKLKKEVHNNKLLLEYLLNNNPKSHLEEIKLIRNNVYELGHKIKILKNERKKVIDHLEAYNIAKTNIRKPSIKRSKIKVRPSYYE